MSAPDKLEIDALLEEMRRAAAAVTVSGMALKRAALSPEGRQKLAATQVEIRRRLPAMKLATRAMVDADLAITKALKRPFPGLKA